MTCLKLVWMESVKRDLISSEWTLAVSREDTEPYSDSSFLNQSVKKRRITVLNNMQMFSLIYLSISSLSFYLKILEVSDQGYVIKLYYKDEVSQE